ncbi:MULTISPECIES: helix-turn-helix domain-containing protein [Bacillus cereus group]|uniref:helix-turn-helix domain-containing protein n=1 Tax=Bacillus cereus group TaxID=86661 RepID=UPI00099447EC|nr:MULTISPECIES: helix-turn-helix domain-containing protein [Bacillus cereus group]OOR18188.1 DNA-binding protein [Bacillus mycoides]QWG81336.1 DNA-binding protein [Bacillus mycoides]TXR90718.1 DNA-binding protein [Bacillus sp. AR13-1]
MDYKMSREEIEKLVNQVVLTANETANLLDVTTQRLHVLVKQGRLIPIKVVDRVSLYFREDVEKLAEELEGLRGKYRPYE